MRVVQIGDMRVVQISDIEPALARSVIIEIYAAVWRFLHKAMDYREATLCIPQRR